MTPEQLLQICPKCRAAQEVSDALNEAFEKYNITSTDEQAAFVAQCGHESAQFNTMEENLNYSAKGLAATWPNRYKGPNSLALSIERKPELIANHTYADRMGNGSVDSGDGWRYRGRGWLMLTGKENYTKFAEASGLDAVNNPDLVATAEGAALSAGWFWTKNHCGAAANDCRRLTKIINGGDVGLADRQHLTDTAKQVLA